MHDSYLIPTCCPPYTPPVPHLIPTCYVTTLTLRSLRPWAQGRPVTRSEPAWCPREGRDGIRSFTEGGRSPSVGRENLPGFASESRTQRLPLPRHGSGVNPL